MVAIGIFIMALACAMFFIDLVNENRRRKKMNELRQCKNCTGQNCFQCTEKDSFVLRKDII